VNNTIATDIRLSDNTAIRSMTVDRWTRLEELFHAALALPAAEREVFLERACGDDYVLRSQVGSLIASHEQGGELPGSPFASLSGRKLAQYVVGERVGHGGMGVVYKAYDTRLQRTVALKALPPGLLFDENRKLRFMREARAASALNHPHIVTIHDIDEVDGVVFIVMELIEGVTLETLLRTKRLEVPEAIEYGAQIASALGSTHASGIVHRDLKPANVMVTRDGSLKVLDFGLAKLTEVAEVEATHTALTQAGAILGTAAYMSPEQIEGRLVDARSDVFSFGALLYEMVTGQQAFKGETVLSTISAILGSEPVPVRAVVPQVPVEVEALIAQCLRKRPAERLQRMDQARAVLVALRAGSSEGAGAAGQLSRLTVRVGAGVLIALLAAVGWLWYGRQTEARTRASVPEIRAAIEKYNYAKAFQLTRAGLAAIPGDAGFNELLHDASTVAPILSEPAGASVSVREYGAPGDRWIELGVTPLSPATFPRGTLEWRFSKDGFQEARRVTSAFLPTTEAMTVTLARVADVPDGMIPVPGITQYRPAQDGFALAPFVDVDDFYLDKFEVTNRQFKKFVDDDGYGRRELWRYPFIDGTKEIAFEQAIAKFIDRTGQAGPATWELKEFPPGEADAPVSGVSWYEAAAYAAFVGKTLPPVAYWARAAALNIAPQSIAAHSNFNSKGVVAVGSSGAVNAFGAYDMAGNVREWCLNAVSGAPDRRYLFGGGFGQPTYIVNSVETMSGFDRSPINGFRLAIHSRDASTAALNPIKPLIVDHGQRQPVPEEEYRSYPPRYAYDHTPLKAKLEQTWGNEPYWIREKVTFEATNNRQRMIAYVFKPRNALPRFQTVIFYPGTGAQTAVDSSTLQDVEFFAALVRSGRAVVYPIYEGTYERGGGTSVPPGGMEHRDKRILQYRDFSRTIDYLESREEFDVNKLAFYGISWGGGMGAHFPALEKRLKVNIMLNGGLRSETYEPDVDPFNFAPHVTIPTLMINGKYDPLFPVETSQNPLFRALGTPPAHKHHELLEIGHEFRPTEFARLSLDWLNKYLGTVTLAPAK